MPLTLIVRDLFKFAKTRKEAKAIISKGQIEVDGRVQREDLFPVGIMDVISTPGSKGRYRILPSRRGFALHPIGKEETAFKLCRIENKTIVAGGHVQLNLHDGRNILFRRKDVEKPEEDLYQTLDTLKISIPDQEILEHFKLRVGAPATIVDGKNRGKFGNIVAMEQRPGQKQRGSLVTVEDKDGNLFQTILNYIFVLGEAEPSVSLSEAA